MRSVGPCSRNPTRRLWRRPVLNVPVGILADRGGRKPCLVGGAVVNALGMAASGFARSMRGFTTARAVAGAGNAAYLGTAQVYLSDARFLWANQAALLLGVSVGPAVGGVCAQLFGLRAPFLAVAALSLAAAGACSVQLKEPARTTHQRRRGVRASSWACKSTPLVSSQAQHRTVGSSPTYL